MGNVLVNEASLQAIADAIRVKNGSTDKYLPSEMPSAIEGIQSGGETDCPLNYITTTATGVFKSVTFPKGYSIEYELKNIKSAEESSSIFGFTNVCDDARNLEKFKLITRNKRRKVNIAYMFRNAKSLKIVDFSECDLLFCDTQYMFYNCDALEEVKGEITMSSDVSSQYCMFIGCSKLKEVIFAKESLTMAINFKDCIDLSTKSIQSIIDGLATVKTAQTITWHKDIEAKLSEEQKAQITSKNWTIAFSS